MTNNQIGGLVIGAVVILAGILFFIFGMSGTPVTSPTATTTASSVTSGNTGTVASIPSVTASTQSVVSNSTAVVTGAVTPNGSPTSYWFEYGRTDALGTRTTAQSLGSGFISLPAPAIITALSASTQYFYRLSATNALGTVTGQTYDFTTNTNPPPQAAAPAIRLDAVSTITRTTATLNGQVTPRSSETTYWFEYGETTDLGHTTVLQSAGSGTAIKVVAVSVSNLKPLTKYYVRLNAQNQYGTVNSAAMNFTTDGPGVTTVLAPTVTTRNVSAAASSTATLHGSVSSNGAATTYWFEYSADPLMGGVLNRTTPHVSLSADKTQVAVQADVAELSTSTKYYFRIVAENSVDLVRGEKATFNTK